MRWASFFHIKYFSLSVLLHLCVGFSLYVTWPDQFDAKKPSFIFLGQLLLKSELDQRMFTPAHIRNHPVPDLKYSDSPSPLNRKIIQKPLETGIKPASEKTTLKSTFALPADILQKNLEQDEAELGIDLSSPIVEPLRLNP